MRTQRSNGWMPQLRFDLAFFAFVFSILFVSCSSKDNEDTLEEEINQNFTSFVSCSAVASKSNPAINESVDFTFSGFGGTAPYTFSSLSVGTDGTVTSSLAVQSSTSAKASARFSSNGTKTVSISIRDAVGNTSSCNAAPVVGGTSSTTGPSCTIVASPNSLNINETVSFLITGTNGTAPYNFAVFSPGAGSQIENALTPVSNAAATAAAKYTYSGTKTATVFLSDATGNFGSCSTTITVNSSTSGTNSLSCNLTANPANPQLNESVVFFTSVSGGSAPYSFTNFSPGSNGTLTQALLPVGNNAASASATYSTNGSRTAFVFVSDAQGNYGSCSTSVTVGSGSGGGTSNAITCAAFVNPNPSARATYTDAYVVITKTAGSTVSLKRINFPANMGITGYFTSSTAGKLFFPNVGTYSITMIIGDDLGNQGSCTVSHQVY